MNYSEVHCKLCGVSFTIRRIRQAHEPWESGWAQRENRSWGLPGHVEDERINYVRKDSFPETRCRPEHGCHNVSRRAAIENSGAYINLANRLSSYTQMKSSLLEGSINVEVENGPDLADSEDKWECFLADDADDTDYSFKSDSNDEPYEYQSEDESDQDFGNGTSLDLWNESPATESSKADPFAAVETDATSSSFTPFDGSGTSAMQATQMAELVTENDQDDIRPSREDGWEAQRDYKRKCAAMEHLAGPHCINKFGYSGFDIGAEEMRGCTVMQCLFRKELDWCAESDDQPFELTSDYYLSSLSGYVPSRDDDWAPKYVNKRHNHDGYRAPDDILWHTSDEFSTPMPFHPTCFEIFTRVSRLRLGHVDIEGLAAWRLRESDFYDKFPRHPAVMRGNGQSWTHVQGDSFLAANPVLIPDLPSILHDAMEVEATFSVHESAFGFVSRDSMSLTYNSVLLKDPFLTLPREIIDLVLENLSSPDIAHLRLSSKAFKHLPVSLFRRLLQDEVPWFWEAWDDTEPSIWAIHTAVSLQECTQRPLCLANQLLNEQHLYKAVITREMPEAWEAYREDHPWLSVDHKLLEEEMRQEMLHKYKETIPLARLTADRTNWYTLYCIITRHRKNLKGLQNRERIWEDIEEIVRRIKRYREESEISAA